jgi:hypothetical protein
VSKVKVSQSVFASILNVSVSVVQKWGHRALAITPAVWLQSFYKLLKRKVWRRLLPEFVQCFTANKYWTLMVAHSIPARRRWLLGALSGSSLSQLTCPIAVFDFGCRQPTETWPPRASMRTRLTFMGKRSAPNYEKHFHSTLLKINGAISRYFALNSAVSGNAISDGQVLRQTLSGFGAADSQNWRRVQ